MASDAERAAFPARRCDPPHLCNGRQQEPVFDMIDATFPLDLAALEDVLENSQDCIAVVDLLGRIRYMNLPGLWQMEIDDRPQRALEWSELWSGDCADLAECSLELARCGRGSRFSARRASVAGAVKWWDVVASPVFDPHGEPAQMFCISRDITDLKQAECSLRDTVAARNMTLLEINHRIKNSLAGIAAVLSLQANRSSEQAVRASLLEARSRVMVVAEIHRRLYETDAQDRIDVGDYLVDVAHGAVSTLSTDNRIVLQTVCEQGISLPSNRALCMARVVTELITNCAKHAFGPGGGGIRLQLRSDGERLLLKVEDDGRGLPEDFDPSANSGLGLSIVAELVNQLQGQLQIERTRPGAHFQITLPR